MVGSAKASSYKLTLDYYGSPPLIIDGNYSLVLANGMSKAKLRAYVTDLSDNPQNGVTVTLTDIDGNTYNLVTSSSGYTPVFKTSAHATEKLERITATIGGMYATSKYIWFIQPNLEITTDAVDGQVKVNKPLTARVSFGTGSTPLPDVPIVLNILNVASTTSYDLTTDASGQCAPVTFESSSQSGTCIMIAQIGQLPASNFGIVYIVGDGFDHIYNTIAPNPMTDPLPADGKSNYRVFVQLQDNYSNGAGSGIPVIIKSDIGSSITLYTNDQGWVYYVSLPSTKPGLFNYTISSMNKSGQVNTSRFTLTYASGTPDSMTLKAYPDNVASGEVINDYMSYNIHDSQVVATVLDQSFHPVINQDVTLAINGTNASFIVGNNKFQSISGVTDMNGQLLATLRVGATATYEGIIPINSLVSGTNITASASIKYTNESHLNVSAFVSPKVVNLNDTVNVTVKVDGVGWQFGREPIDLMFVVDKSGSMGDAMNNNNGQFIYNAAQGGWFNVTPGQSLKEGDANEVPTNNTYYKIWSFNHNQTTRMIVNLVQTDPVMPKPAACFTATPVSGDKPLVVQFTDKSTAGTPTSWQWDFGDGTGNSTLQNPQHVYLNAGTYTVTMTSGNSAGSDSTKYANYITVKVPIPVASFTANTTSAYKTLCAQFTDLSTNAPTAWQWNFGDGTGNSTLQNPVHTYSSPGQYTVTLTATNAGGSGGMQKVKYITVNDPVLPTAAFTGSPTSGVWPLNVAFTDQSTGTGPLTYAWNFGDGVNSTLQSPSHTYNSSGTYTVTLTVTSTWGANSTVKTNYVTVNTPILPVANFTGSPTHGWDPLPVTFTDLSIGSGTLWYNWSFGDGTGNSTAKNPTHTYSTNGTYTVTLTVSSIYGANSTVKSNYISVDKWWINVDFTADKWSGDKPLTINFTDAATCANPADITQYYWYIYDPALHTAAYVKNTSWTYTTEGTFSVRHWVYSASRGTWYYIDKTVTITKPVATATPTPTPTVDFAGVPTSGLKPLAVAFTDLSTNAPTSWLWSFGDGVTSTAQNPSHTYNNSGSYTVTLTAWNGGGSGSKTKTNYIIVSDPLPPTAKFYGTPVNGTKPLTVVFTDQSTGTAPLSYAWDFGDSSTSTLQNPSHTYANSGTYTVTLTVTNAYGVNSTVKSNYIVVTEPLPPTAQFNGNPLNGTKPLTVVFTDLSTGTGPLSYAWSFGDGTGNSTLQNPSHSYANTGSYTVTLTVTSAYGISSIVKTNYVVVSDPVLPVADFSASPVSGTKPLAVAFTDLSTGTGPLWYNWSFGDGVNSTAKNPPHTYNSSGSYTVTLTVTSPYGASAIQRTNLITVSELAPVADFIGVPVICHVQEPVSFVDKTSNNPNAWQWSFGDGTSNTAQNPTHIYNVPGIYTVSLLAKNFPSGQDTKTKVSYITVKPYANFHATPQNGDMPLDVQFADDSLGAPETWQWDFGDGKAINTSQNPLHTYDLPGNYTVTLTVTANGTSETMKKTSYITVNSLIPHGIGDDTYLFHLVGPNNSTLLIPDKFYGQQILFGNLANIYTGAIDGSTYAAPTGTYDVYAVRTYTQGPKYGYQVEAYDMMKLGQSCDVDSMTKTGARWLINNRLWVNDRAGLVTFANNGNVDSTLSYVNGSDKFYLLDNISKMNSYGWTDTTGGLQQARLQFEQNPNPRPDAQKIAVLITDGKPVNKTTTEAQEKIYCQAEADLAVAEHIKYYTIAVADDESNVDKPFLMDLANRTGGWYRFCNTTDSFMSAINDIGRDMDQNITKSGSTLNILPQNFFNSSMGVWQNNTTYVGGSASRTLDGDLATLNITSPYTSMNGTNYMHMWNIDPVKLSHNWTLSYQVRANTVGYTRPVGNLSFAAIIPNNTSQTSYYTVSVESDNIYVVDPNATDLDMLSVHISLPYSDVPITQPTQTLLWLVTYNGISTYNVVKEYAPFGTNNWKPIGKVDTGNWTTTQKTFSDVWNLEREGLTPGTYTLRIRATDGMFNASDMRNITVQYEPGNISLVDSKI